MKKILLLLICLIYFCTPTYSNNEIDSLLKVLDKVTAERSIYTSQRERKINEMKQTLVQETSLNDKYLLNEKIIEEYESFVCDSALTYIYKNIEIAETLGNEEYYYQSRLKLAFVLSISGLFTEALEIFDSIEYEKLSPGLKLAYCWGYIRYYENLMKYTDNPRYVDIYFKKKETCRDTVMALLGEGSGMYQKEKAFKLQALGRYKESAEILTDIFVGQDPSSHSYAMSAMSLAIIHRDLHDKEQEEKYLLLAAITDSRLGIKENESLLTLAILLYEQGDINRAYNYIRAALDDANFFNSRFRNTVITRVQPIIEATYLSKIEQQKKNLRLYAVIISVFVVVLVITLYILYRQIQIVLKARKKLKVIIRELASVNQHLDEANLIKERYIGYYINQCAVYLDKLDEYRKNINRKIKAGQIDDVYKLSASTLNLEKDVHELYNDFDKTFFEIYPNFVEDFNALLRENERYVLKKNQLNTELRIFALIRLGITDVNQIAKFLRYSIQTIYNYKSKVKGKAIVDSDNFEDKVREIGVSYK